MKLQLKNHSAPPFDVASGQAPLYLDSGKYEQYIPHVVKRVQKIKWHLHPAQSFQDVLDAPYISFKCESCGNGGTLTGSTCHLTQSVRCGACVGASRVPDDIGEQYAKLRKEWEPTNRRVIEAKIRHDKEVERLLLEKRQQEYKLLAQKLTVTS